MEKQYCVYIMTNPTNTVLYTGITSDLPRRVFQHKAKETPGFTEKYNCVKLVYFEVTGDVESAISREKQIKAGSRRKKIQLIDAMNPDWEDLSERL
jgi:putative endonuclease